MMSQQEIVSFASDYMEGAHPAILRRLAETNLERNQGYGSDPHSDQARERIRSACLAPSAAVHFLVGGTQANSVVIRSLLGLWQGVVAAKTGHINVHEAGAIEAGGHKVIPLCGHEGKLSAEEIETCARSYREDENRGHMVEPKLVYLSHPTELGTLYTAAELMEIRQVCDRFGLYLYLDGARLGYGLAADTEVTLPLLARCCDVFTIGGTKVGALFGEAVVIPDPGLLPGFFTIVKQQGALLAKGWLLGLQFDTLFTDGLYWKCGRNGIRTARRLKGILQDCGIPLWVDSPTNQQFAVLDGEWLHRIEGRVGYSFGERTGDGRTVARFATSWATADADVDAFAGILAGMA